MVLEAVVCLMKEKKKILIERNKPKTAWAKLEDSENYEYALKLWNCQTTHQQGGEMWLRIWTPSRREPPSDT